MGIHNRNKENKPQISVCLRAHAHTRVDIFKLYIYIYINISFKKPEKEVDWDSNLSPHSQEVPFLLIIRTDKVLLIDFFCGLSYGSEALVEHS